MMPQPKEVSPVPTYISLCRWTQHGVQNIKESPKRLESAKKGFAKVGAKLVNFYMVTGTHDMVIISEAPNDETIAKAMLTAVAAGNITTQTMRAFTEDEYKAVIQSL